MSDVTRYSKLLENLENLIHKLPGRTDSFRNQSKKKKEKTSKERALFRQLTVKLAGDNKDEQVAFLLSQAESITSKLEVVKASLNLIPKPPDFKELKKTSRRTYRGIYSLIDKIVPLAAGSTEPQSQLKLLEARWMHVHKLQLMPYTMNFKTLLSSIDKLPWTVKEDGNDSVKKGSQEGTLFRRLLEKLLGNDKQNQLNFLMHQAKVIDRKTYITRALKTIPKPPTYSELTKNQRRAFEHVYSLVEEVVRIAAGSTSKEDQLKLLEDRWLLTHKAALKVTWKSLQSAIESLPNPKKHCDLSVLQRKHGQHMQRTSCLEALIKKIAQSDAVEDHIELTSMCLVSIHKQKPMPASFLTARHLPLYFQHLRDLPAFTEPIQKYRIITPLLNN